MPAPSDAADNPFVQAAIEAGLPDLGHVPLFSTGYGTETALNSAPFLLTLDQFRAHFGHTPSRLALVDDFAAALGAIRAIGCTPVAAMIGGSMLRAAEAPNDLDCLLFYEIAAADPDAVVDALPALLAQGGSDIKLCPVDAGLPTLLKRAIFFSHLFAYDRASGTLAFGTILIDLTEPPA